MDRDRWYSPRVLLHDHGDWFAKGLGLAIIGDIHPTMFVYHWLGGRIYSFAWKKYPVLEKIGLAPVISCLVFRVTQLPFVSV
jgi:hypothetical protein